MTINVKSAFISGLAAGITIIIVGLGLVPIVGEQMNEVLESCSLPPLGLSAMIIFPLMSLTFGLAIVWLYALIQPKFKSKFKAALVSAIIIWFYIYLLPNVALVAYGFMPFSLTAIGTAWGVLEVSIASIVGSRLYKEAKKIPA